MAVTLLLLLALSVVTQAAWPRRVTRAPGSAARPPAPLHMEARPAGTPPA